MSVTRLSERFFGLCFAVIVLMFALCALALIGFAGIEFWQSVQPASQLTLPHRFDAILNCVAMLTIAMAALELAHTIVEEEFDPASRLSAAARARRVLSRFLVVVIVSLAIESLVATFKMVHDDPSKLSDAAFIALGAAALLVAWGVFLRLHPGDSQAD